VLSKYNVEVSPTFIVRHDYSAAEFDLLQDYLVRNRFSMPYPFIYTPLPGTELWGLHEHELITHDYEWFDLFHLTLPPVFLGAREFMRRFSRLYLENPSWQAVAARAPLGQEILDGIAHLETAYPNSLLAGTSPSQSDGRRTAVHTGAVASSGAEHRVAASRASRGPALRARRRP